MNKILAILSLIISTNLWAISSSEIIDNSVKSRINSFSLEQNVDYYKEMSSKDKLLMAKLLYKENLNRLNQTQEDKIEFSKIMSQIAEFTTTNMTNHPILWLELPGFSFNPEDNIIKDYKTNILQLLPSTPFLLDFKNKKITMNAEYPIEEFDAKNNYVQIAYDSVRNLIVIIFPELNSTDVSQGSKMSYNYLQQRILNTNPLFNIKE